MHITDWIIAGSAVVTLLVTAVVAYIYWRLLQETRRQVGEAHAQTAESREQTRLAVEAQTESQRQTRLAVEAQYDRYRPLLYPSGNIGNIPLGKDDGQRVIDWNRGPWGVELQNAGAGIAVVICGVFFGQKPAQEEKTLSPRYTLWRERPLHPDESVRTARLEIGKTMLHGDTEIKGYTLYAPPAPSLMEMQQDGKPYVVARLTLTYRDIFGRKHASISDYHDLYGWQPVVFLSDISDDLEDLDRRILRYAPASESDILTSDLGRLIDEL